MIHPMVSAEMRDALDECAALQGDLDDICLALQRRFKIETGDGAAYCLADVRDEWPFLPFTEQRERLRQWLEFELSLQR
jgi:hypothetical protein